MKRTDTIRKIKYKKSTYTRQFARVLCLVPKHPHTKEALPRCGTDFLTGGSAVGFDSCVVCASSFCTNWGLPLTELETGSILLLIVVSFVFPAAWLFVVSKFAVDVLDSCFAVTACFALVEVEDLYDAGGVDAVAI